MKRHEGARRAETLAPELLERMADVLKTLAHPHRLRIVELLEREKSAPVHLVIARLGMPQTTVSQHLNRMRRAGLVGARRQGKEVWYGIADRGALTILECIRKKGRAQ